MMQAARAATRAIGRAQGDKMGARAPRTSPSIVLRAPRRLKVDSIVPPMGITWFHPVFCCIAIATRDEPLASKVSRPMRLDRKGIIMYQIKADDSFTNEILEPFMALSSSPNTAHATKHDVQNHLSFRPAPANVLETCTKHHKAPRLHATRMKHTLNY